MRRAEVFSLTACFLALFLMVGAYGETTYHVAPCGDDSNPGTQSEPFLTIQKAADIVKPGDTVIVRDGVYGSQGKTYPLDIRRSGKPDAWITFKAEHKWQAVLDGEKQCHSYINFHAPVSFIWVEDFQIMNCNNGGFWCQTNGKEYPNNTHHIVIKGNYVHNIGNYETESSYGIVGIYVGSLNSHITLDSNLWHDIGRTGPDNYWMNKDHALYLAGWPPGPCHHITAINNIMYYCSGQAIEVGCDDSMISNNTLAWSNTNSRGGTALLSVSGNRKNVTIQNNIFYQPPANGSGQSAMWAWGSFTNVIVRNNIVFGGTMWYSSQNPNFSMQDNYCRDNCQNLEIDPLFMAVSDDRNTANDDWHLKSNSPAIDAGHASGAPDYDHDGNKRDQGHPHIGAYE